MPADYRPMLVAEDRGRDAWMKARAPQLSLADLLRQSEIARRAADLVAPHHAARLILYAEECEAELARAASPSADL